MRRLNKLIHQLTMKLGLVLAATFTAISKAASLTEHTDPYLDFDFLDDH